MLVAVFEVRVRLVGVAGMVAGYICAAGESIRIGVARSLVVSSPI